MSGSRHSTTHPPANHESSLDQGSCSLLFRCPIVYGGFSRTVEAAQTVVRVQASTSEQTNVGFTEFLPISRRVECRWRSRSPLRFQRTPCLLFSKHQLHQSWAPSSPLVGKYKRPHTIPWVNHLKRAMRNVSVRLNL